MTGHLTQYRRVVAQMERPELFAELGVRSFAVCGVLCCAGGVVVGRRHRAANYQAGMWQLAPAGSVDAGAVADDGKIDLRRQLLGELEEELGLPPDAVGEPRPLCVVEHPGSHVSDLGLALVTRLSAEEVLAAHRCMEMRNMSGCWRDRRGSAGGVSARGWGNPWCHRRASS